jgi:hypothetical protein
MNHDRLLPFAARLAMVVPMASSALAQHPRELPLFAFGRAPSFAKSASNRPPCIWVGQKVSHPSATRNQEENPMRRSND